MHEQQRLGVAGALVDVVKADVAGVQVARLEGERALEVPIQRGIHHSGDY